MSEVLVLGVPDGDGEVVLLGRATTCLWAGGCLMRLLLTRRLPERVIDAVADRFDVVLPTGQIR